MKIKNNYNCEKCLNKNVCKYYDNCKHNSDKDLFIKPRKEDVSDNLTLSITCDYYRPESTILYRGASETGKTHRLNDYIDHSSPFIYPETNYNQTGTGYSTSITNHNDGSESNSDKTTIITNKKYI